MEIKINLRDQEVIIGGVPTLDEIRALKDIYDTCENTTKTEDEISSPTVNRGIANEEISTASNVIDFDSFEEGETGDYFQSKIMEANQQDTYQFALNTAGAVQDDEWYRAYNVRDIQCLLNEYGFNLACDGIYGKHTNEAVENFGKEWIMEELDSLQQSESYDSYTDGSDYIEYAKQFIGLEEHRDRITDSFFKEVGFPQLHTDETAWCGAFVGAVMKANGYSIPKLSIRALEWLKFGKSAGKPVYGAIAVKKRKGGGHVCFVVGQTDDKRYLYCLGGNQRDKVSIVKYRKEAFEDFRVPFNYIDMIPLQDIAEAQNFQQAGRED